RNPALRPSAHDAALVLRSMDLPAGGPAVSAAASGDGPPTAAVAYRAAVAETTDGIRIPHPPNRAPSVG
ncbi:MAG: hypothetical protein ACHP7K_12470, partial [Actinomycetales bacterium]